MSNHCPICDSRAEVVREERDLKLGRREVVVEHELHRCPACAESWYSPAQMDQAQRLAAHKVREEEGLLHPDDIRAIREELELSQADFEKLLGFGPKTVGRWERGTVFQNQSSDTLLRVVQEFPEVARFLAMGRGVQLPKERDWRGGSRRELHETGITGTRTFKSTRAVPADLNELFPPTQSGSAPLFIAVTAEERSSVS